MFMVWDICFKYSRIGLRFNVLSVICYIICAQSSVDVIYNVISYSHIMGSHGNIDKNRLTQSKQD